MSLVHNGQVVATNSPQVSISRTQYAALSEEGKLNANVNYFVYDDTDESERLTRLLTVIGSTDTLAEYGYVSIIDAIKDINDRLGGLSFKIDPEINHIQAKYSDEVPSNEIEKLSPYASDSAKLEYFEKLIGDASALNELGYSTLIGAIIGILNNLDGLEFKYNDESDTVEVANHKN